MNPVNSLLLTFHNVEVLNSNQRLHHLAKARRTKHIRTKALYLAKSQAITPMQKAHCFVQISFADHARRDVANYYPSVKAAIDGFIDANLLPDDDSAHLIGPDMRLGALGGKGLVGFHFEFFEVSQ